MLKRRIALLLATGAFAGMPAATAEAYVECGNPAGPATNVTATRVSCSDARSFARTFANRRVTSTRWISLPGWRSYYAKVRRAGGEYDVRATRANKVIRFQYRRGGGGGGCDPNTQELASARTQVTTTARAVPATGPTTPDTSRSSEMTTTTLTATGTALPARTDAGQRDA